ncbi:abhydrolase domain-containing protein 13 [Elysia marginata]|uniref:Abhydrolase domain-containing protein 13 n=1 Tax=Elysia marginata TaxID=1093978 RepID=A0AAV4JZQ1_9GAST|nr:abhydrolase domain-containing protein 13 [Elysia marginata]
MDELVPPKMMKDLYNKSRSNLKRLEQFTNGTHNDTWMCPGYYEALMRFVPEALRSHHTSKNLASTLDSDTLESITSI